MLTTGQIVFAVGLAGLAASLIATIVVAFAWSGSAITGIGSIFSASMVAAKELFNIFLIIALMTALLNSLKDLGSDIRMVKPFRAVMKNVRCQVFDVDGQFRKRSYGITG